MGGVYLRFQNAEKFAHILKMLGPEAWAIINEYEIGSISYVTLRNRLAEHYQKLNILDGKKSVKQLIDGPDSLIINCIEILRENGYKTGLLTNVGYKDDTFTETDTKVNKEHFDVIVESCIEKMRKPFKEIYLLTAERLRVKPEECIFIDDLIQNCYTADDLGMTAIELKGGDSKTAVKTLGWYLGLDLLS
ncbi:unnamed protein product [Bursaphelenchus okinawaensis]|uniref:Uncharacterized protein n=1 Tax=Bursaphelenchus okinawaensis TaxID=465554 RepID=A0A811K2D5_9BILA|nr:unnamed protein product [Bursaphelenchus okinawaensis]CAG9089756.1 unnamed protein product [Bursaphelenchus okinawaensis]